MNGKCDNSRYFILLVLLFNIGPIQAVDFTYSGYIKSYALIQDEIEFENSPAVIPDEFDNGYQSQNAVRLMGNWFTENSGNVEVHYEIQPVYYSNTSLVGSAGGIGSTLSTGATIYRYKDLDVELDQYGNHMVVFQNLDRLNYQYSNETGDFTLGRQVVSFGSSRFINPTDIFIPFNIQTLNQEYRVGIDAIRYQAALGDFAVLDTGLIIGEDAKKENSAFFIRGKNSLKGNDVELIVIALDDAWLLGGGLERAIGDFGFWFETAYMDVTNDVVENYWRTSIGSDYALTKSIITSVEYHYNGAGSDNPDDYLQLVTQFPYQKAGVFLLGENYLIPAVSWIANPLVTVNASGFINIDDHSAFINVVSEVSWTENLYSDFGMYVSYGDVLESQISPQQINLGSEFGSYPLSIYASLRYYF
ncbi:MAG: hypothetical protein DIZ80_02360 [endosymbiont of Galathealinum brachiosum]|uniref:Alginate export domain-containing protein n=1 Tax=endosymbiont of Galathealinum brachiosum TaxID=2200906 RepID=A0A370DL39_9GAMM|nr:MAG: hypothetical protein DIZ80_02360 [endosymbiont of Galathealinum brachiosum]